jgi:uncharacterized membrane protein YhaH (DUF805 family)
MSPELTTAIEWAKRPILEKYADFTGRASRPEYWWYVLAVVIAFVVARIIEGIVGLGHMIFYTYGPLSALLWLATIVPSLAVGVRRLHDTDRSGWWLLICVVPYALMVLTGIMAITGGGLFAMLGMASLIGFVALIGALVLLYFMVLPGTPGQNRYGQPPAGGGGTAVPAE